jgi:hypothetical protein
MPYRNGLAAHGAVLDGLESPGAEGGFAFVVKALEAFPAVGAGEVEGF